MMSYRLTIKTALNFIFPTLFVPAIPPQQRSFTPKLWRLQVLSTSLPLASAHLIPRQGWRLSLNAWESPEQRREQ